MAEKVAKLGVKREEGYLYFIDKNGDVSRAAMARGGKKGISKVLTLFPLLITMSMKKATTTYLALLNRS